MAASAFVATIIALVVALLVVGLVLLAWRAWRTAQRVGHPMLPREPAGPPLAATIHDQHVEAHRIVRELSRERDLWPERERIISDAILDADARVGAGYGRRAGDIRPPLAPRPEGQSR